MYGPIDLLKSHDIAMLGATRLEAPDAYHAASPTSYLDRGDPPILILHGTADRTVKLSQSEEFAEALDSAGVEHELLVIPDALLTFLAFSVWKQRDLRPLVLGFFDRHLKKPRRRPLQVRLAGSTRPAASGSHGYNAAGRSGFGRPV